MRLPASGVTLRVTLVSAWYTACLFLLAHGSLAIKQSRKARALGVHWMPWLALPAPNLGHPPSDCGGLLYKDVPSLSDVWSAAASAPPGSLIHLQTLKPYTRLSESGSHFSRIPRWFSVPSGGPQGWVLAEWCYTQVWAVLGQEGPAPWWCGRQALENVHSLSVFMGYHCVSTATSLWG